MGSATPVFNFGHPAVAGDTTGAYGSRWDDGSAALDNNTPTEFDKWYRRHYSGSKRSARRGRLDGPDPISDA